MKEPQFKIPRDQHLSLAFLARTARANEERPPRGPRHLFRMGRYALCHSLKALGVGAGDEVLVPAYLCATAVEAVQACGAAPVFFRVARDCSLDLDDAQRRVTPRTRALLAVHYFGFPQSLDRARALADQRGLVLIEDCAHVLSGTVSGRPLGSIGDASIFSWRKFLPLADGGELVLNVPSVRPIKELRRERPISDLKALNFLLDARLANHRLARRVLQLPSDFLRLMRRTTRGASGQPDGESKEAADSGSSFDPRLADAAISRISEFVLEHSDIPAITSKRRLNYQGLEERLARVAGVEPLFTRLPEDGCPLHFPVFFEGQPGAHRQLRELGIPATAWDGVRPRGVRDEDHPDAGFLYENLVFLPVYQNLEERDLDLIAGAVRAVHDRGTSGARPDEKKQAQNGKAASPPAGAAKGNGGSAKAAGQEETCRTRY